MFGKKDYNMYYGGLDSVHDSKVKVGIDGDLLYYKLNLYTIELYNKMIIPNGER